MCNDLRDHRRGELELIQSRVKSSFQGYSEIPEYPPEKKRVFEIVFTIHLSIIIEEEKKKKLIK